MKRRELIKISSTILAGASVGAFAGYNINKNDNTQNNDILTIEPKQTAPYEYSCPMPFDKRLIDELVEINSKIKKGKITTLFSSLPDPLSGSTHPYLTSIMRGTNTSVKTIEDYLDYISYAREKGFKCVYILNTTAPVNPNDKDLTSTLVKIFKRLNKEGIEAIKVTNPNLIHIFSHEIPELELQLSTTNEYKSAQTYKNLVSTYPTIKLINIAADNNHNLDMLISLKKLLPNVKIDVLVNEINCIKNCPAMFYHAATAKQYPCKEIIARDPALHLTRNNLVHPWQLEYLSAIGINCFKITSIEGRNSLRNVNHVRYYVECVEKGIEDYSANDLLDKIYAENNISNSMRFKESVSLKKLVKALPDFNKLIANSANCDSNCGTNCRYCFNCAEKVKKLAIFS